MAGLAAVARQREQKHEQRQHQDFHQQTGVGAAGAAAKETEAEEALAASSFWVYSFSGAPQYAVAFSAYRLWLPLIYFISCCCLFAFFYK